MDLNFSESGMQLTILKLTAQNNALLKTILKLAVKIEIHFNTEGMDENMKDHFLLRSEKLYEELYQILEPIGLHEAYEFAVKHDPDLNFPDDFFPDSRE
jgi:hypothetical protein